MRLQTAQSDSNQATQLARFAECISSSMFYMSCYLYHLCQRLKLEAIVNRSKAEEAVVNLKNAEETHMIKGGVNQSTNSGLNGNFSAYYEQTNTNKSCLYQ